MVADDPESFADLDGHDGWDVVVGVAEGLNNLVNHAYDTIVATAKDPFAPISGAIKMADEGVKAYETSEGRQALAATFNSLSTQDKVAVVTEALVVGGIAGASNAPEADPAGKTYQTYTKPNPETGEVYSGRTTGTPEGNVAARDAGHHMNEKGFKPAKLDKSSSNPNAIRGREQQLIKKHGGAKSEGGTSGNAINGVSPRNRQANTYRQAAEKEFGQP
jgi:hypothetical protein